MYITKKFSLCLLLIIILLLFSIMCSKKDDEDTEISSNTSTNEDKTESIGELKADPDAPDESFVVFVDELNMREKPSLDSNVLEVLKKGDKINYFEKFEYSDENDGYDWAKVKTHNGIEGWVAIVFTIQESIYAKYSDIISLVKEGKMKSAKELAIKSSEDHSEFEPKAMLDSTGNYMLINVSRDEGLNSDVYGTIIYLKKGDGLIGYCPGGFHGFFNFGVSDTKKYIFSQHYSSCPVYEVLIRNLMTMKKKSLGICYADATLSDKSSCEFAPESNILVYVATDEKLNEKHGEMTIPALFAYDPISDTTTKLMEADLSAFPDEEGKILLKPVLSIDSTTNIDMNSIMKTDIYQRYINGEQCKYFPGAG